VLLDSFDGWSSPFYFFGIAGVVWFILFVSIKTITSSSGLVTLLYGLQQFLCYSDPESHPYISDNEKNYLKRELKQLSRDKNLPPTPWKSILTSVPMMAM
jgi:MFS transporter, ACS family, solute carrier family 17 (sodium-dependent inorganic phosphate cotransporter), other